MMGATMFSPYLFSSFAHALPEAKPPIPPKEYFPLTASLGEEVANCSPACGGAGWRSQTEGGCARGNKHRRPHPPFGVLPPNRFAWGRGKFPLTASLGEEVAYV
jgi:hypothetical protein